MGLFDEVVCEMDLPREPICLLPRPYLFQTKDLDCNMAVYTIDKNGILDVLPPFTGCLHLWACNVRSAGYGAKFTDAGEDAECVGYSVGTELTGLLFVADLEILDGRKHGMDVTAVVLDSTNSVGNLNRELRKTSMPSGYKDAFMDLYLWKVTIGLELVRGQTTYHWYGESVGDTPLPPGFSEGDLGHCEHAIRIPLSHPFYQEEDKPYEIGVVRRRDGMPGYQLLWDYFCGGFGLSEFVGGSENDARMPKLKQAYALCATARVAKAQGFRLQEQVQANGTVRMVLTK